jgi:FAD:protein FMN transferase
MPRSGSIAVHHFEALGTTCSLFGLGVSATQLACGEAWVRETGARLTRFSPCSEVSRLNRAAGAWVDISQELEEMLRESLRAFELSAGLVNVAVLSSMLAIGYTRTLAAGPTAPALEVAKPLRPLPEVLNLRPGRARLERGWGVDLGGVAKGWMADRLTERLGQNTLANVGGDLRSSGPGPEGDGWPVRLAGVTLMLKGTGAATSSVRRRRWGELHHLIDPRTGLPSRTELEEVSVVATTGVKAEVVAKTALLAGRAIAQPYCAAHAQAWWFA